jgi:hypothetical protein
LSRRQLDLLAVKRLANKSGVFQGFATISTLIWRSGEEREERARGEEACHSVSE